MNTSTDTIVAPATASGGAIAVIRLSGPEAIACCDRIFRGRKPLAEAAGHTLHYGEVIDGDRTIDDVVAAIYRAPHSYTGEDAHRTTNTPSQPKTAETDDDGSAERSRSDVDPRITHQAETQGMPCVSA